MKWNDPKESYLGKEFVVLLGKEKDKKLFNEIGKALREGKTVLLIGGKKVGKRQAMKEVNHALPK